MTIEIGSGMPRAAACALPRSAWPARLAEFDALLASAVRGVVRVTDTRLRLVLNGSAGVQAVVRDLTARESECCSFFGFALTRAGPELVLEVTVPPAHIDVLDNLAERARAGISHGGALP